VHRSVSCSLFMGLMYFVWLLPCSKYWPTVLKCWWVCLLLKYI
jgi:hypothetical protein